MLLSFYKIRTYAQLDTWSHETKQNQTKAISHRKPLLAQQKTALTSFLTRPYVTTPQTQKQSQTKPISPPGAKKLLYNLKQKHKKYRAGTSQAADTLTRSTLTNGGPVQHHVSRTKGYDTGSGAAEPRTSRGPSAALAPRLCRLNNNSDKIWPQNPLAPSKTACNPHARPKCTLKANET